MEAARQETRAIATLGQYDNFHLMQVLGTCWPKKEFAVELLTKTQFVAGSPRLAWCARVGMALSVLEALDALGRLKWMHGALVFGKNPLVDGIGIHDVAWGSSPGNACDAIACLSGVHFLSYSI
jgi:hypothetical protein